MDRDGRRVTGPNNGEIKHWKPVRDEEWFFGPLGGGS